MDEPALDAMFYDGKTSRPHAVRLEVGPAGILLTGEKIERGAGWHELRISERTRHGPRLIEFADGARCEVFDTAGLSTLLHDYGPVDSLVVRAQQSWRGVLAGLVLGVAVIAAGYTWGLPWLADRASRRIPDSVVATLSAHALGSVEKLAGGPSRVPAERRAALEARARQMWPSEAATPLRLHFRSGGQLGPNALALPSGDIVVTDQLIALANGNDDMVLAVVAHELGHIHYRHGLRMVLQSTVVGALVAAYFGDAGSLATGLAAAGLQLRYSRGFEFEADRYAADTLTRWSLSPELLATMLERLEGDHRKQPGPAANEKDGETKRAGLGDYLSSHPDTAARMARLRDDH